MGTYVFQSRSVHNSFTYGFSYERIFFLMHNFFVLEHDYSELDKDTLKIRRLCYDTTLHFIILL